MGTTLTPDELRRYSRHLLLPEFGIEGQERLKASSVLLIGAGGLGSPAALYLAAAGIGRLGIVDPDCVDDSNLQRQVLHSTADLGRAKVESARERLTALNPAVQIETWQEPFTSANAMQIAAGFDLILDGTDNFPTRYLSNDVSVFLGIPNVYGSIYRFEGQVAVFDAKTGPCYRCLFPEPPPPDMVPSCAEGGVLGVLPAVVGSMQATEAIKVLTGIGEPLIGRLLLYDALAMRFRELAIPKDSSCPVCGDHPTITSPIDYAQFCGVPGTAVETAADSVEEAGEITVEELAQMRKRGEDIALVDVREDWEADLASIGGTLIPLGRLEERLGEIPRDKRVVVYCKSGIRSARAQRILQAHGYEHVQNLAGGITAWSERVDPGVRRY